MNVIVPIIQIFAIMAGFSIGITVIFGSITMFWVRKSAKGKILAIFLEKNNQIETEMLSVGDSDKIRSKDGGDYLIVPSKMKWSRWPASLPNWMREVVPTLFYNRNQAEPYDPMNNKSAITAKSLRYITDEGMLKQTWREAREAIGEGKALGGNLAAWIGVGSILVSGGVGFLVYKLASQLEAITKTLDQLKQAAGL